MTKLFLDITLVYLRRRGQARAQAVSGVELDPLRLWQVGAEARVSDRPLDQADDVLVAEPVLRRPLSVARDSDKERAEVDLGVVQPLGQGMNRASPIVRATADFHFAPAGLAAQGDQNTTVQDLDPAAAVGRVVFSMIEGDDLRSAQAHRKPEASTVTPQCGTIHLGPAGEILQQCTRAVARPISVASLGKALPGLSTDQIAVCRDAAGRGGGQGQRVGEKPISRAATVLEAVLTDAPRAETAALLLADAALARTLGWDHRLPLLATGLKTRDLRKKGDDLQRVCHRAVVSSAKSAVQMAADLLRKAGRLRVVVPKLRAKGAGDAVAMFLKHDALAPSGLTSLMSDLAARRLCDRLVELGALRELTGRDSFRLYGA